MSRGVAKTTQRASVPQDVAFRAAQNALAKRANCAHSSDMPRDKESPWYSTPAKDRNRKPINLSLPPETIDGLDALAEEAGLSRSQVVETLVQNALKKKRPKST